MKRKISHICNNCKLFDAKQNLCSVVILHEGQRIKLPVDAQDACFFEGQYFDPIENSSKNFTEDIQQVRFWVEDEDGNKTDKDGTVKIEYPEHFFGEKSLSQLLEG